MGERLCDVIHVTSAARPGQEMVDDNASIQEIISTYQNFDIFRFLLQMCQTIQKICAVFETHIICRLHYRLQRGRGVGLELCDVILEGVQSSVTKRDKGESGVIFFLKLCNIIYG